MALPRRGIVASLHGRVSILALLTTAVLLATTMVPAGAVVPDGFVDEVVATGYSTPVGLAFLPDGRLLVTEQFTGEIELLPVGANTPMSIFTVPDVDGGGEAGLLGITVDPAWPVRPYIYVIFNQTASVMHIRMYTASGDLTDPASSTMSLSSPYNLLTDIPAQASIHNAGTLRFGPDDMLYVSTGDDGNSCSAQVLSSLSGKILRLDVSSMPGAGSGPPPKADITPPDNPFPGPNANERLLYCYGLRNPFRFHVDPVTGNLYIGDVGPATYEEVNEATGGDNFGWPKREGMHDYPPGAGCSGTAGTDPIWEWNRTGFGASVIGGPRYRESGANSFPGEYFGDVFLHDYYQGWMRRLTFDPGSSEWVVADPVPGQPSAENWATGLNGVPDVIQGADGAFYFVTQFDSGTVRRIRIENTVSVDAPVAPAVTLRMALRPNPLPPGAGLSIGYEIERAGHVRVSIFDAVGQLVSTVVDGPREAGIRTERWDGRRADGTRVATGLYFVRLETGGHHATTKLTLFPRHGPLTACV